MRLGSVKFFEPAMGGQIVEQSFRPLTVVKTIAESCFQCLATFQQEHVMFLITLEVQVV